MFAGLLGDRGMSRGSGSSSFFLDAHDTALDLGHPLGRRGIDCWFSIPHSPVSDVYHVMGGKGKGRARGPVAGDR